MKKLLSLYQELKDKENIKELARRDKFLELHSWNYPLSTVAELEDKSILEELKSRAQQDESPVDQKSIPSTAARTPAVRTPEL